MTSKSGLSCHIHLARDKRVSQGLGSYLHGPGAGYESVKSMHTQKANSRKSYSQTGSGSLMIVVETKHEHEFE